MCIGTIQNRNFSPTQKTDYLCFSSCGLAFLPQLKHVQKDPLDGGFQVFVQIDSFVHVDVVIVAGLGESFDFVATRKRLVAANIGGGRFVALLCGSGVCGRSHVGGA